MTWKIDAAHSQIEFTVRHMMITNARGRFDKFEGTIEFDETNPAKSKIDVQVDLNSISTRDEKRDGHLKSPDFFDVANYPTAAFKSKNIVVTGKNTGRVTGDLTIRGITHEVTLDVEFVGILKNPWGAQAAGFNAHTKINRKDWGLNWNVALEAGGWLVGDEITINIEVELNKVPETVAQVATA